jgi:hypothetical protein
MIYIGYDQRNSIAAEVCKYSLKINSSKPLDIQFLKSADILNYRRSVLEPQSTDFTFTRFWVPCLSGYKGYSIFCDCDFLFLSDISNIDFDPTKAVSVVKRKPYIPNSEFKMDGVPQHNSLRKNWASMMVFNNEHPDCKALNPEYLNTVVPGKLLHIFDWTDSIGELDPRWNVLDGYDKFPDPYAVHYTDGGPWFEEYKETYYSSQWIKYYENYCEKI